MVRVRNRLQIFAPFFSRARRVQNNEEGIEMRELRNLEFKEIVSSGSLKTVSAFANYGGGTILLGVDDGVATKSRRCLPM